MQQHSCEQSCEWEMPEAPSVILHFRLADPQHSIFRRGRHNLNGFETNSPTAPKAVSDLEKLIGGLGGKGKHHCMLHLVSHGCLILFL